MPNFLAFLCYLVAGLCFAAAALGRGRYDSRVTLLPLGLLFWVLVPLVDAARALD